MVENLKPISLYCSVGKTEATIYVPTESDLKDNVDGHVETPCKGCQHWSDENIKKVEQELYKEWGDGSGITEGRVNKLRVLLVDQSRFKKSVEPKLIVAMCSPIDAK